MKFSSPVSLDVLLLLVLVPAHVGLDGKPYLLVVPFLIYVLLELWIPLAPYSSLPEKLDKTRLSFLARLTLLLIIIAAATIVPTIEGIRSRYEITQQSPFSADAYRRVHDGAIQVEVALSYLQDGKNPYVENYENTPLRYFGFSNLEIPRNPAIDHFVYLPGFLLISYPAYSVFERIDLFYDQRLIYLLAYVLMVLLLPLLVEPPAVKLTMLAAIALNPLLTGPVIVGMNDVLLVLIVVFMGLALKTKHLMWSAVIFGLACAFKQSAWFLAPFYVLYLIPRVSGQNRVREITKLVFLAAITAIVIIAPFALWDISAFVTDVFAYPAGSVPVNYPIRGYTIGSLLVGTGVIDSPLDRFPFWALQLLLGIPLLLFLLRYQRRRNTIGSMLVAAGVFTFGMGFLSRFFQDNYVGYIAVLITMGVVMAMGEYSLGDDLAKGVEMVDLLPQGTSEEE